jgi:hypothetical protein
MLEKFKEIKTSYIILPKYRIIDALYYFEGIFNFESINFKFDENNKYSNFIIIDQTLIDKIDEIKKPNDFNYLIMIWNSDLDIDRFKTKFENIEKKYNIKLNIFCIDTFYKRSEYFITTEKLSLNKKKFKIYNLNFGEYFKFKYPYIYYFFYILKSPLSAFLRFFNKKVVFFGSAILTKNEFSEYTNIDAKDNFTNLKKEIFNKFASYNFREKIDFFNGINKNINFKSLMIHEKYYVLQIIFRYIFVSESLKLKNFRWHKSDSLLKSYQSPYFKNDYYIDFGSKISRNKIYSRYLFLNKFKKKIININFFENFNGENNKIEDQIQNSIKFFKQLNTIVNSDKTISAKNLIYKLQNKFKN